MEKLKLHSPDFIEVNIKKLAELFPNCVTENCEADGSLKKVIDFDQLRQELSTSIVEGPQERYQLNWPGKREALLTANAPIVKTLRPCREESVDFDTTQNLFIEGDNLDALKLLQETYLGKVKMIYIDPPYNTGNDFIYHDKFNIEKNVFDVQSGFKDETGNRLTDQEPLKQNSESNGRFHSDWLSMMYSRLKLARNLLQDDGVIFISIDDGEQANLKRLCDEIFGTDNFVVSIIWQKRTSPDMRTAFSQGHEYVVLFAKTEAALKGFHKLPISENQKLRYKNPDKDPRGSWVSSDFTAQGYRPNQMYPITTPGGKIYTPPEGRCWKNIEAAFLEQVKDGRFWFGADGNGVPRRKNYLIETDGRIPWTWWSNDEVGHSQEAKQETNQIFQQAEVFSTPKPVRLIERMLQITTSQDECIILDFFSGSCATAHAVMHLNAEDDGNRKFIMVQLPETCDEKSEAYKAGFKTIAEIGKERIRRAGKKIKAENFDKEGIEQLDIGFRVLKIDSSNMKDVYYTPDQLKQGDLEQFTDNIKDDRSAEDLLFQVLLDWGVDLTLPITQETICGKTVLLVDGNALAACFDTDISEAFVKELAARHPLRVVFRDAGFISDSVKINIEQVFKLISPVTEIKVI